MNNITPKQTILFDLDDTLVHCNKYFNIVIEHYVEKLATWFYAWNICTTDIPSIQSRFDIEEMKQTGFASEHFPRSFIDTYQYFSNLTDRKSSAQEKEILWKLGMSIYEMDIEPYSGMIDVL